MKQPKRPHYIQEWAESRGFRQVDVAQGTGADPGTVSNWYKGSSPGSKWQVRLATFFGIEPPALFRHPDEEWMADLLEGRSREEIERIKATIETAFPRKS